MNEPFEKVVRRFRREVEKAGLLKATKVRNYYEKPSVKRKRKAHAVRKRWLRRTKTNKESQKKVIGTLDAAMPWIFIKKIQRGGDNDY